MTTGLQTVIYPVKDLSRSTALFGQLLGAEPIMDEPYHVGLRVAGQDVGLDPHGYSRGMTGRWAAGMSMTSPRVWRSSSRPARRSSRRSPMSAGAS